MLRFVCSVGVLFFLLAAGATAANAAPIIYCVPAGSVAGLQFAIDAAKDNDLDDEIHVEAGTFTPAQAIAVTLADTHYLRIWGGWTTGCGAPGAGLSMLNGSNVNELLYLNSSTEAFLEIEHMGFSSIGQQLGALGSALHLTVKGEVILDSNEFISNAGGTAGGIRAQITCTSGVCLELENSIFVANSGGYGAALLTVPGATVAMVNNTVVSNTGFGMAPVAGFAVHGAASAMVANNVFWNNDGADIDNTGPGLNLYNNDLHLRIGDAPAMQAQNFDADPRFAPGLFNLRPISFSPLVNAGLDGFQLSAFDFSGNSRHQGPYTDIGAFETDVLFATDFDGS